MPRGFSHPILLLLIVVVVLGGVFYISKATNSAPQTVPQSANSNEDIANWKTYSGNGFSFKYPNQWEPDKTNVVDGEGNINFFDNSQPKVYPGINSGGNMLMTVSVDTHSPSLWNDLKSKKYPEWSEATIAGKPAMTTGSLITIPLTKSNDRLLNLSINNGQFRDQILSTLTFTVN